MANFYISNQNGDDANDGSTPALAKKTINTITNASRSAGDVIYIGPGVYREIVMTTSNGADGNPIKIIGDPQAIHLTGDTAGIVRVTGCNEDEEPSNNLYIIDMVSISYWEIWNLHVDGNEQPKGSAAGYKYVIEASNYTISGFNCYITGGGYAAVSRGSWFDCVMIGCYIGAYKAYASRCVVIAPYQPVLGTVVADELSQAHECLIIGGYYTSYKSSIHNCITLGGTYGHRESRVNSSMQVAANSPFYLCDIAHDAWVNHCYSFGCTNSHSGSDTGIIKLVSANHRNWSSANTSGPDTANSISGAWITFDYNKLIGLKNAFEPVNNWHAISGWADTNITLTAATSGSHDILYRDRYMKSSTTSCDVGPYEMSNSELSEESDVYTYSVSGIGEQKFKIAAATGDVTIEFDSKMTLGTGVGSSFWIEDAYTHAVVSDVTATMNKSSWSTTGLTTTVTGNVNMLEFVFYNNEASDNAYIRNVDVTIG